MPILGILRGMSRNRKPGLMRPAEVAERLGVTVQTIRNWTRRGGCLVAAVVRLPSGQRRFDAAKVEALVRQGRAA